MISFHIQYDTVWGENLAVFIEGNAAPVALSTSDGHWWSVTVELDLPYAAGTEVGYRYAVWRDGTLERCEVGRRPHTLVWESPYAISAHHDAWTDVDDNAAGRMAGTAIPVFSLRSEGSQGVGDFGDLRGMVDWCVKTGQRALQILPINDTTKDGSATDSYPYSSISIFALHPMYMDLRQLTPVKTKQAQSILAQLGELNKLDTLDYTAVNALKQKYLRLLFDKTGVQTLQSSSFQDFYSANEDWLLPYAAFCYLRDKYGTPCFGKWRTHSTYDADKVANLAKTQYSSLAYYMWVQFLLHLQLKEVASYARANGVLIKGDIPIGIDPTSVEAWQMPHLFNATCSAGAPPDAFSANGQNWGFPTYNWEVMASDGYAWWRRRFGKMAEYFDAYRIDHVLGFFRIWEVPAHSVHAMLGQFAPALPMTADEIAAWGLEFCEDTMTHPYITSESLLNTFGEHTQKVKNTFLTYTSGDRWSLRPEYDTQRKIEQWFKSHSKALPVEVRESLYSIVSDVLFVRDRNCNGWHPRIMGHDTEAYHSLTQSQQEAFSKIYEHYFYHRHNHFWYEQAMLKLPALVNCTSLIPCGEDLGMVPACVPWVMNLLRLYSLEIERMPKAYGVAFGRTSDYPAMSVCTIGTHDMSTMRGWWREDESQRQCYYNEVLGHEGLAPAEATPEICAEIVQNHLQSPSALAILALQDWLAIDDNIRRPSPSSTAGHEERVNSERINIPADPHHCWCYRMHITLEELMDAGGLNDKIASLVRESGRCA